MLWSVELVHAVNSFSADWIASRHRAPKVASGLAVWPLLGELALGASGTTRTELVEALRKEPVSADVAVLIDLMSESERVSVALATWLGSNLALDPEWIEALPNGTVRSLTGDSTVDQNRMDEWVRNSTDGKITSMPVEARQDTVLMLASAVSLATEWEQPLQPNRRAISQGPWANDRPYQGLDVLTDADTLRFDDDLAQWTAAGTGDVDVALVIGRPELPPSFVLSEAVRRVDDSGWGRSGSSVSVGDVGPGFEVVEREKDHPATGQKLEVETVAFDLTERLDLLEDAAVLGLTTASNAQRADFSRLCADALFVGQARQESQATFGATGFEATSVTAVGMVLSSAVGSATHRYLHQRVLLKFDRPFGYVVTHRPSGLVLLAGWVDEPRFDGE